MDSEKKLLLFLEKFKKSIKSCVPDTAKRICLVLDFFYIKAIINHGQKVTEYTSKIKL